MGTVHHSAKQLRRIERLVMKSCTTELPGQGDSVMIRPAVPNNPLARSAG
jgi:hypothetical protein